jgi:hypothetical protein
MKGARPRLKQPRTTKTFQADKSFLNPDDSTKSNPSRAGDSNQRKPFARLAPEACKLPNKMFAHRLHRPTNKRAGVLIELLLCRPGGI